MSMELSRMFGMDIYSTDAEYIGKAYEFIIDLEEGRIVRITLEPLRAKDKATARQILKKKSILYDKVVAVKDIILIDQHKKKEEPKSVRPVRGTLARYALRRR